TFTLGFLGDITTLLCPCIRVPKENQGDKGYDAKFSFSTTKRLFHSLMDLFSDSNKDLNLRQRSQESFTNPDGTSGTSNTANLAAEDPAIVPSTSQHTAPPSRSTSLIDLNLKRS
ncbi:MAG: hypothetical protein LQ341_005356, partial [Variospora aurantia]